MNIRSKLNFTWDSLDAAKAGYARLKVNVQQAARSGATEQPWVKEYRDRFKEAIADDLNMPRALAVVWDMIGEANRRQDMGILDALYDFDQVLGLNLDIVAKSAEESELEPEFAALISEREQARADKNWARADELRKELATAGVILEDRPEGTIWRRQ